MLFSINTNYFNFVDCCVDRKILWENRYHGDRGRDCLVSVDGTDFRINEPKPFWKGWYSHKFHGPGVRYEVGVGIQRGDIVCVNGPFPCGTWSDIMIFRDKLKGILDRGERVEADSGYGGEIMHIDLPHQARGSKVWKKKKVCVRARHETVNGRFKDWGILRKIYIHHLGKHHIVFHAVVVITQLGIENGRPLFHVNY